MEDPTINNRITPIQTARLSSAGSGNSILITAGNGRDLARCWEAPIGSAEVVDPARREIKKPFHVALSKLEEQFTQSYDAKAFDLYIPSLAKGNDNNSAKGVLEAVSAFLSDPEVLSLLVLGDSGLGKSTLALYLTRLLWQQYHEGPDQGWIPLLINLPAIDPARRQRDLLAAFFKKQGIKHDQQLELLHHYKLLLILDGYDEIPERKNLWHTNGWPVSNIKMVTLCRPEVLLKHQVVASYQELFYPPLPIHLLAAKAQSLQELTLQPFTSEQIDQYLQQYVKKQIIPAENGDSVAGKDIEKTLGLKRPHTWHDWKTYRYYIDTLSGLDALVETPFILSLVVLVLPDIINKETTIAKKPCEESDFPVKRLLSKPLTRAHIYDYFVRYWFAYQAQRIQQGQKLPELMGSLEGYLRLYSENLARHLLCAGKLDAVIDADQSLDPKLLRPQGDNIPNWYREDKEQFTKGFMQTIRSGCLLKTDGGQFSYLHKSLLEYFAANEIFNSLVADADFILASLRKEDTVKGKERVLSNDWQDTTFNEQLLIDEGVLQRLADRVRQDSSFSALLFGIIDYSKHNPLVAKAASNAITILNQAGVSLAGRDFAGICVPKAKLSGALLSGTNFTNADLTGVYLHQAYISYANFTGTCLKDVSFGQLPALPHANRILSLSCSSDGNWLATGDEQGYIHVWSRNNGRYERRLKNWQTFAFKNNPVVSLSFRPNLPILAAVGSSDCLIRLWDVEKGKCTRVLSAQGQVAAIIFSADGQRLTYVSKDQTAQVWELTSGKLKVQQRYAEANDNKVTPLNEKPLTSEQQVTGGSLKETAADMLMTAVKRGVSSLDAMAFSSNNQWLATANKDKCIQIWELAYNRLKATLVGHEAGVNCLAFSLDGQWLASGSHDKTVRLWEVAGANLIRVLTGYSASITSLAFWEDQHERWLAFSVDSNVHLLELKKFTPTNRAKTARSKEITAISNDAKLRATAMLHSDSVLIYEATSNTLVSELMGHIGEIQALAFSLNSRWLATFSTDNAVRIWEVASGKLQLKSRVFNYTAGKAVFSPNEQELAVCDGNSICLWEITNKKLIMLTGHQREIRHLAFSSDGQMLATAARDYWVGLWEVASGKLIYKLIGHDDWVNAVAFSADNQWLASASDDHTIQLWQVTSGTKGMSLKHNTEVSALSFSPDNKWLASGQRDYTVCIWDISTARCVARLPCGDALVTELRWQSDSTQLTAIDERRQEFSWRPPSPICQHFILTATDYIYPLTCSEVNITDAIGLSAPNKALLMQRGAMGSPSNRSCFYNSYAKLNTLPDTENSKADVPERVLSLVSPALPVVYDNWVVSIIRHPHSSQPDHAALILEGMSCFGKAIFVKLHLVDNKDVPEQALILISVYPNVAIADREEVLKRDIIKQGYGKIYCCSWSISRMQALHLYDDAKKDQSKIIHYHISGDRSFLAQSSYSSKDVVVHNCFTWVREKLLNLNDDRFKKLKPKYSDFVGAKTSFYIGPEGATASQCLMM